MLFRKLSILIMCMLAAFSASAALTAQQVLDKVSATLTSPASVSVNFTFSSGGQTGHGTMTVCRDWFTYNAADLAVWYDGHSQWALQRSAGEVSLTEPTADELLESNPFRVISSYRQLYNCQLLQSSKGTYKVKLLAKSRTAAVQSAVITVNVTTFQPVSIEATLSGGTRTKVSVTSFIKGKALPKSFFQFNPKANPSVEVIDLR